MKQIRIASVGTVSEAEGRRFVCEWMEGSLMNKWFLKARLADALAVHGVDSHWIEARAIERGQQPTMA